MTKTRGRVGRALALAADLLVVLCVLAGLWALQYKYGRWSYRAPRLSSFRTFTVLSNAFLALSCALALPFEVRALCGARAGRPRWVTALRFVAVCAVSVTFWTVLLFLRPATGSRSLHSDSGFWLHLVAPVLGALAFFLLEREGRLSRWEGLLGAAPVFLYGAVYFARVVVQHVWDDFYLFNRGGRWPVSMAAMFAAALALAFALRALHNRTLARAADPE